MAATPLRLVAGAAIGRTLVVVAIELLAFLLFRRQRKKRRTASPSLGQTNSMIEVDGAQSPWGPSTFPGYSKPPLSDAGSPHGPGQAYPPVEIMGRSKGVSQCFRAGRARRGVTTKVLHAVKQRGVTQEHLQCNCSPLLSIVVNGPRHTREGTWWKH